MRYAMINVRRLPGILFIHKWKVLFTLTFVLYLFYLLHQWGFVCTNYQTWKQIEKLCEKFRRKEASGTLCEPLCVDKAIDSIACVPAHSGKELVFIAHWSNIKLVFKSSASVTEPVKDVNGGRKLLWNEDHEILKQMNIQENFPRHFPKKTHNNKIVGKRKINLNEISEGDFEKIMKDTVSTRLNISISNEQLERLKYLQIRNKYMYDEDSSERRIEKLDILNLLKSQEYLLSSLFSDRSVFPRIYGTCGSYFAVEYLDIPWMSSIFVNDDKQEWVERMKLAILVMDLIEDLETNFPDALHLCDMKMSHFGLEKGGQRLKFLDLDTVYTNNILEKTLASGRGCDKHEDCDLLDCKSLCNSDTKVCDSGVANNNLQIVCEKIFIGWTMSGKMIVPGLLMSEHTPASLAALLRLCAENQRSHVPEDIRQKLYTTLTEMDQLLSNSK